MMDSDQQRYINEEIRRQMNVILNAAAGTNDAQTETISALFPGMPDIPARPVMHPFGFVSRAPAGIISVIARIGAHFGNRMVIGHRDKGRPAVSNPGESIQYSIGGYNVRVNNDSIQIGKNGENETLLMGETTVQFFKDLIDLIVAHTHASPGAPPMNLSAFNSLKSSPVSDGKLLSKDGGKF